VRFGYLEIDQNLPELDYYSQNIFKEKTFKMCWENEGATNDYFYLKNPLYYIYGSRDLFKGILESKFEYEIE